MALGENSNDKVLVENQNNNKNSNNLKNYNSEKQFKPQKQQHKQQNIQITSKTLSSDHHQMEHQQTQSSQYHHQHQHHQHHHNYGSNNNNSAIKMHQDKNPITKSGKQTDANISFLRAARSGDLEKIIEFVESGQVTDINTCNANGLNALHLAAKDGYVDIVSELLKRGANVDNATKKGNTALHIASLAGQKEVIKLLIQYNANVNVQSLNGFTPLYMAAQENHDACVRYLLAKGANPSLATEDGFTPLAVAMQQGHDKVVAVLLESDSRGKVRLPALHIAAKKDDVKAATLLLENEHNPDIVSKSGFTPLHIAAHYGNLDIANLLIEKGADVNYTAKHNITPLHVACKWGKLNILQLLLSKGAKIDSTTRDGLTPLHCAARSGHDKVIETLLRNDAPILSKTKNGLTPLHMAAQGEHDEAARILIMHKASVDEVTVDYLTALHVAAHCGHVKVAKLLLDHNADPNSRALNGFTPLHIACKKNRIKVVELLLKHNASISATTESGLTPLHVASFMGCMNIVLYLLQHEANPDVPTVRGETPLHLAARANQTDIIRILLRNGAQVDVKAREGQTPLHVASRLGNVDIVMLLLQHGANVDSLMKDSYTPLHIAAKECQEEVATVLIENGASLDASTKKGFTPLHLAAKYGDISIVKLLLQKGASVDAQGKNGVTPLHVACHYDRENIALLLLEKGASPHPSAKNGHTALHIASKKNQMEIATYLLQYGAKVDAESKSGFTPLHLASQEGNTEIVNLLMEHGANPNYSAKNGLTPIHLCAQEDEVDVSQILLKKGAKIDEKTKAGFTPLHVAAHFGQINMVKFLLENDANIELSTNIGYTPLHQAAQQGHTLIISLLLTHKANPNALTNNGQTALSIANKLGYVTAVETLKIVTETSITNTVTGILEEKYKVVAPESMHETFMSDSEDECGEDHIDQHQYKYMATDDLRVISDQQKFDTTDDGQHHLDSRKIGNGGDGGVNEVITSTYVNAEVTNPYIIKSIDNVNIVRQPIHVGYLNKSIKLKQDVDDDDEYDLLRDIVELHLRLFYDGRKKTIPMLRESFLVSFLVDARGGAMRGCRHSGVRVIVPPKSVSQPTRITCRYVKPQRIPNFPPLMEGEALVSRILELSPVEAKFLGPVILEVPHFGSLRNKEREIIILRSDNGETWREHTLYDTEEAVREVLNETFESKELSQLEDLHTNRIIRIVTHDFPHFFAVVSRIRQEVHAIGPDGGTVSSTAVPQVQAIFPPNALTKKIRVGLQAQPVDLTGCAKLLGQGVAVSPVVTVEPRRRKFHKAITLSMPAPRAQSQGMVNQYSGNAPTLRLLCSITGGQNRAIWEDVTGSTPLTFVKDSVSFTTTVSARFWLMDCRNISDACSMATDLYKFMAQVPFMVKFVVFAKRISATEAKLSVFCMTDDKEDKTLEHQEFFTEIAKSRDVEVLEGQGIYLEFVGNLVPVMKSGEQLNLKFYAFRENRLSFTVRVKDQEEPFGRISFMSDPKKAKGDPPQVPICTLNVSLVEQKIIEGDKQSLSASQKSLDHNYRVMMNGGGGGGGGAYNQTDEIHKADIRLSDICNLLENDWENLAHELNVSNDDIQLIRKDYQDKPSQQAMVMLRLWLQKNGPNATGNTLEQALHKIKRSDIVEKCIFNLELVTDEMEKAVAKMQLDQSGFDNLKEELELSSTKDLNYSKNNGKYDEKKDDNAEFNSKEDETCKEIIDRELLKQSLNITEKSGDGQLSTPPPTPIDANNVMKPAFDSKIPPTAQPEATDLTHHEDDLKNTLKLQAHDVKEVVDIAPITQSTIITTTTKTTEIINDVDGDSIGDGNKNNNENDDQCINELIYDDDDDDDDDGDDDEENSKISALLLQKSSSTPIKPKTIKKHSKMSNIIKQQSSTRPNIGDIEWNLNESTTEGTNLTTTTTTTTTTKTVNKNNVDDDDNENIIVVEKIVTEKQHDDNIILDDKDLKEILDECNKENLTKDQQLINDNNDDLNEKKIITEEILMNPNDNLMTVITSETTIKTKKNLTSSPSKSECGGISVTPIKNILHDTISAINLNLNSESDASTGDSPFYSNKLSNNALQNKCDINSSSINKTFGSSSDSDIALHEPGIELSEDETEADFYQNNELMTTQTPDMAMGAFLNESEPKIVPATSSITTETTIQQSNGLINNPGQDNIENNLLNLGLINLEQQQQQQQDRETIQKVVDQFMAEERKFS